MGLFDFNWLIVVDLAMIKEFRFIVTIVTSLDEVIRDITEPELRILGRCHKVQKTEKKSR